MYVVRFVRKDGQLDEAYYYNQLDHAQYHFNLFMDDDSGLYHEIAIYKLENNQEEKIYSYQLSI